MPGSFGQGVPGRQGADPFVKERFCEQDEQGYALWPRYFHAWLPMHIVKPKPDKLEVQEH